MVKVKIVSNPYQKRTEFQNWDEGTQQWQIMDANHAGNSKLLCSSLTTGFFPFKVKRIVDLIVCEYSAPGEQLEIVFEGTRDEYIELKSICDQEEYKSKILLSHSNRYLENARDILPDIIGVFQELRPLVTQSVESASNREKINRQLAKFSDASNDCIPICVIGNYSSGKSTFINALLGYELLPSSDEPTTAKIYKISQTGQLDRAFIQFEYGFQKVRMRLDTHSCTFLDHAEDNPLSQTLKPLMEEVAAQPIFYKLNRILESINSFANSRKDDAVSDLIEIEVPFDSSSIWGRTGSNFVIFDTPGSNSASNIKHYQVLKKAMEDLSNGLPIFISEYNSLDSTDNDKLYQDINNMEELDNRFTMIIVNKADAASLKHTGFTEDDRQRILSLAIPRQLYSGGLYFVSSVMGLGSKNEGQFLGDHNAEIFEDQKAKYTNPASRFYKQLYRYNILPEQIKREYDLQAEKQKDLLYTNSGLYTVEWAIGTFARVYSPYNKCQQSRLFLDNVIQIASNELAQAKEKREAYREHILANLKKETRELIDQLKQSCNQAAEEYKKTYSSIMKSYGTEAATHQTKDNLVKIQADFLQQKKAESGVAERKKGAGTSAKHIASNFGNAVRELNFSRISKIGADAKELAKDYVGIHQTEQEAKQAANTALLRTADRMLEEQTVQAQNFLESHSRAYWTEKAGELKRLCSQIVTHSDALTDEKRIQLSDLILEYHELTFDPAATTVFDPNDFQVHFFIFDWLSTDNLVGKYNTEIESRVSQISTSLENCHQNSFQGWMKNLLFTIIQKIVTFSPGLHEQKEIVRAEEARISELTARKDQLQAYYTQIQSMMDWKTL